MLAVLFIAVVLLQFSSAQETIENDPELQELDTAPILNETVEENLIQYIQPTSTDILKTADEIPLSDTKEVQNKEKIQPINTIVVSGPAKAKGAVTISTCYGREDSCSGEINEETSGEECPDDKKTIINTTIELSNPVKTDGKIIITTQFGCEATDGKKGHKDTSKVVLNSNEVATEVSDEPIIFNGCAKGQEKVTIAANYGCGGNDIDFGKNPVKNQETDSKAVGSEEFSEESVSFGGTVPVQGKISIGTHYGCGGPYEMPPMPWFPTYYYPQFYAPPPYFIPGLVAEYPAILEAGSFASSEFQEQLDSWSETVNKSEDMNFNGVVPVRGTMSIAAKY